MARRASFLLSAVAIATLLVTGCTAYRLDAARKLARASEPFSTSPPGARAQLLVVGDSTAVGTGASSPLTSVAGQLAQTFPGLAITNLGADGAKFADVAQQLVTVPTGRYDAVLILAGGNDVIRLTADDELRAAIGQTLQEAARVAPVVVIQPAGNVGNAPFFFAPWSWWMTQRAQTMHEIIREASKRSGAAYVDLYKPKAADPFAQQPTQLHAADGLHPNDAGYALWLAELMKQSPLQATLKAALTRT